MKLSFDGSTILNIIAQTKQFLSDFDVEVTTSALKTKTTLAIASNEEKRKPGRPPAPMSKKGQMAANVKNFVTENMVGAVGVEPSSFQNPEITSVEEPDVSNNVAGSQPVEPLEILEGHKPYPQVVPTKITKEMLITKLQLIIEKENKATAGQPIKGGLAKGLSILKHFGSKSIGGLAEAQYAEFYAHLENELSN